MNRSPDNDDLFQPSLQGHIPKSGTEPTRPWRLGWLAVVALLGGIFSVSVMAYLNANRLQVSAQRKRFIVLATLLALVLLVVYTLMVRQGVSLPAGNPVTHLSILGSILALLLAGFYIWLLVPDMQRYAQTRGDLYAAPWLVGLICIFGLDTVQTVVITLLNLWAGGS